MIEVKTFPELTFNEERHIYTLNGLEVPSVTTVMKPLSENVYGAIDEKVLNKAAARGTAVHNAIENYTKYGIEDYPPEVEGYFNAFLSWFQDHGVKPYGSEVRLYHGSLLYAGTADMLAEVDGKDTLIDFKTSASISEMLCGVQLEAYKKAIESHDLEAKIEQKIIVQLKKDGRYKVEYFPARADTWRVFTALLTVWNYKEQFKGGKNR